MSATDPQDCPAEATDRLPHRLVPHTVGFEKNRATGFWRAKCTCHWFWIGTEKECQQQAAAHDMWIPATPVRGGPMSEHTVGDAPIEPAYRESMNAVARGLDKIFNGDAKGPARKVGFVLLVFPFGNEDGRCNYISNSADRKDIVVMLKEQIKRFEGQPEITGHA